MLLPDVHVIKSRAISELNQALLSKPDFAAAENNLGTVFFDLKKYKEAVRHFGRAALLAPDSFKPTYNLGVANLMLHRYSVAIERLTKAGELAPGDPPTHYNLGIAYLGLKNRSASEREYLILTGLNPLLASRLYEAVHSNLLLVVGPRRKN